VSCSDVTGNCTTVPKGAAFGDQVSINTADAQVVQLKDVAAEKKGDIAVPAINQKRILSFVPQGATSFKGVEVKLLLVSYDLDNMPSNASKVEKDNAHKIKGLQPLAQTMVTLFRLRGNEPLWTDLGSAGLVTKDLAKVPLSYTVEPNGVFTLHSMFGDQPLSWSGNLGDIIKPAA
jgi:hypothetical protein